MEWQKIGVEGRVGCRGQKQRGRRRQKDDEGGDTEVTGIRIVAEEGRKMTEWEGRGQNRRKVQK